MSASSQRRRVLVLGCVTILGLVGAAHAGPMFFFGRDYVAGEANGAWPGACGLWTWSVHDVVGPNLEPISWDSTDEWYDDDLTSAPDGGKIGQTWPQEDWVFANVGGGGVAIAFELNRSHYGTCGAYLRLRTGDSDVIATFHAHGRSESHVFPANQSQSDGWWYEVLEIWDVVLLELTPNPDTPNEWEEDFEFDYIIFPEPSALALFVAAGAFLRRRR